MLYGQPVLLKPVLLVHWLDWVSGVTLIDEAAEDLLARDAHEQFSVMLDPNATQAPTA